MAWNKTEIISQCIGVKGESDKDRENRIRQFEDLLQRVRHGHSGRSEFREPSGGFQARLNAGTTSPVVTIQVGERRDPECRDPGYQAGSGRAPN